MFALPTSMRVVLSQEKQCAIAERPVPAPSPSQLLLRVAWSAVNRADTLQRRGLYPAPAGAPDWLGLEAVGVVVARGGGSASEGGAPALGARVMALLPGGGNAEYVAVEHAHVLPVPPSLSLRDAAAIPETWLTAFQLLFLVNGEGERRGGRGGGGGLPSLAGSTVVVHAAGSGVGTAAVQLAAAAGARVVAVAGAEDKLAAVARLGAAEGVNYKDAPATFGARLAVAAARSGGGGAALILDPVGAPFAAANIDALAPDGAWVLYGSLGGLRLSESPAAADALLGALLRKRGRLMGTTLRNRSDEYKAALVRRFCEEALPLLASGALRAVVHTEFPLERIGDAHALMESNATLGKILLRVSGEL
jgi:tumor protein p53-inducible protein 3